MFDEPEDPNDSKPTGRDFEGMDSSDAEMSDGGNRCSSADEEEEAEQKLADVTFEQLRKSKANGFFNNSQVKGLENKFKRANKNRPMEMSSKKPVGRFREVIHAPKKVTRDPRFESLCGTLDTDGFRKRYSFLFEVELPAEREKLQKLLKKSKDQKVIEELKNHISWIDKQLKEKTKKSADSKILSEHKKKEREAANHGKQPYYLKKSEIRERRLIEKYHDLKASGKLESYIEKRKKRNASKDHRFIPYRLANDSLQS